MMMLIGVGHGPMTKAPGPGVNSIDIKNLGPVFGPKLRPILVLYLQFYIS